MPESKRIFDTAVQKLKYDVLKAIIRNEYEHCYDNIYIDIPKEISPGPKATMRCCIFKERAIVQERIKLALGGDKNNPNVVEVIDIACDECPIGGIFVTPACRGCIVHRCQEVCPKGAIQIIDHRAVVDKSKCIECGKCTQACPYGARKADPEFKTAPEKCNFCIHRLQEGLLPACVETCIGKARVFGDLNDENSEIYRLVKENKVYALLSDLGTKPNIFYIGLPDDIDDKAMLQTKPIQWQR